jgi:NitT/TauT family transport system permease protein
MRQPDAPLARLTNVHAPRGLAGIAAFLALWQLGVLVHVPILAKVPTPVDVAEPDGGLLHDPRYYVDWLSQFPARLHRIRHRAVARDPAGLIHGLEGRVPFSDVPVFEVLRPIPPLAWVPLSILFWPTPESSIVFVLFLGAFFTVLINTVSRRARDRRALYVRAAISLGATPATVFRRIILPGALPSIGTGMAVGIGITWSVLVAAEIIAGRNGLGYLTWEAYVAGAIPTIIVGMISIGIAGYLSSVLIRAMVGRAMPWNRRP